MPRAHAIEHRINELEAWQRAADQRLKEMGEAPLVTGERR